MLDAALRADAEDARRSTREVLHGNALSQEDAWQRAVEFLFERLAVRWTISGVADRGPEATCCCACAPRRRTSARFVRDALREHCAEWFPDVEAP